MGCRNKWCRILLSISLALPVLALPSCRNRLTSKSFLSPATTYRSIPFWSLNDSLDSHEICRQLDLMKEGGQGGAFLHSRIGLLTPYLSEEWFNLMGAGVQKCEELGLEAWFYDEDKWPSGFAGGIVPLADQAYRSRQLARVPSGQDIDEEDTVLWQDDDYKYICHVAKLGMSAYNGTCWVDLMNPEMVRFFIECSYAPYVKRFSGSKAVKGIFSDEPQVKATRVPCPGADAQIPYSPFMERKFKDLWGYDLDPVLPSLTDTTVQGWRLHRLHYYRTVAACLEAAFSKQVGDYCRDNGLIWTGHYNGENTPSMNLIHEGNLMQQLRHMQQPGCDALGLQLQTFHNAKVVTSVANQYGRDRRLVEIFGISGHNVSFEDRMWIAGWHTVCGLNFMCPHLSLYSMKGERKRDYPPTLSFQQPYWRDNHFFENFSARLCYFASTGKPVGEICIVSPLESDFIEHSFLTKDDSDDNENSSWDRSFEETMTVVASSHLNFDIADEQIMSEEASVSQSMLRIGEMSYQAVIVPPMLTIRPSTLELLEDFGRQGGKVLVVDSLPVFVEGERDDYRLEGLKKYSTLVRSDELAAALQKICDRRFLLSGEGNGKVYTHTRAVVGGTAVQLFNSSRTATARLDFKPIEEKRSVILDPKTGETLATLPEKDGSIRIDMAPASSILIFTGNLRGLRATRVYSVTHPGETVDTLAGFWEGLRLDANSLPLDFALMSRDNGRTWSLPEPVLAFYKRSELSDPYDGPLKLRFFFEVVDKPVTCSLAVEQPFMYDTISVNGSLISFDPGRWFKDPCIKMADITDLLEIGSNKVELSLDYISPVSDARDARARYGTEIETIYLVGDFGISAEPSPQQPMTTWREQSPGLAPKPLPLRLGFGSFKVISEKGLFEGDLVRCGYPFYSGRFEMRKKFELKEVDNDSRYYILFPSAEAILLGVRLNGVELETLFSSPWEVEITEFIKEGINDIAVTLTGSLRNLMGPYHHAGGELVRVGPGSFTGENDWLCLTPGNNDWYDLRKTGAANLWRDDYFCVPFGLMQSPVIERREW